MTDLSTLSDDELLASLPRGVRSNNPLNLKDTAGQFRAFPSMDEGVAAADQNLLAYKTRHGIDTIQGVVSRWAPPSDNNDTAAYVAHVAKATGIAPDARIDLADAHTRQALLSAMGEHENGAPVVKADLSGVSDAELLASLGQAAPKAPPKAAPGLPATPPRPNPTIAQDAASGFAQPFVNLGHDVMENYRRTTARAGQPLPSLIDAAKQSVGDLGSTAKIVGDTLGLTSAPVQAAIRPMARAINRVMPAPVQAPQLSFKGGKPVLSAPRTMNPDEAQSTVEGALNTALMGARPAGLKGTPAAKPMSLDELKSAKTAAYGKVDAAGVAFKQGSAKGLASDISTMVADEGGAEIYPKAAAMAKRIDSVVGKGDVPLTMLDKLRAQVGEKLMSGPDAEARIGGLMRDRIDAYIDGAQPGDLAAGNATDAHDLLSTARDLNTRYRKAQEVTDRLTSADLRASSTYAGGNQANATRQNLRPLIDPKSGARMRNLTPAETKALNQVVRGTPTQNAMRTLGKVFDPRGLLGATVQTVMGLPTHGLSTVTSIPGMAASAASNRITAKSVQDLIDLISQGGVRPTPTPYVPAPVTSILSPAGLAGAGVTAAPLTRLPDRRSPATTSTRKRSGQRAR